MNRLLRPLLAGGLLSAAAAAALATSGCADNDSSLFVLGALALTPPTCAAQSDPTQPIHLGGRLDVALASSYRTVVLVGNQLTARGNKQELHTETTRVNLSTAEVKLTDSTGAQLSCDGDDSCGNFSVYGAGYVSSTTSEDPGYGGFEVEMIPSLVGQQLAASLQFRESTTIVATVKVVGQTLGGHRVESAPFVYPIDVCYGCSIVYPANGVCKAAAEGDTKPCNIGIDDDVPCSICATFNLCNHDPNVAVLPDGGAP